jgi:hypothetical protein
MFDAGHAKAREQQGDRAEDHDPEDVDGTPIAGAPPFTLVLSTVAA